MAADQVSQRHLDSQEPLYAGVYGYGKSEKRTTIIDGRARKSYGHRKPMGTWEVFIQDHHEGYISWAEYERNQELLAGNAYGRVGDTKSGRGGRALLAGLICCARCGRRLSVLYTGRYPRPVYRCEQPNVQLGQRRCLTVAGKRIDETIAVEMLRAVTPMAIEAAEEAERMLRDEDQDRRRIAELELQQAQYDASLAERRYAACDPDNRLIAAQLEKAWKTAASGLALPDKPSIAVLAFQNMSGDRDQESRNGRHSFEIDVLARHARGKMRANSNLSSPLRDENCR